MSDIVKTLRNAQSGVRPNIEEMCRDAADEIERMRKVLKVKKSK